MARPVDLGWPWSKHTTACYLLTQPRLYNQKLSCIVRIFDSWQLIAGQLFDRCCQSSLCYGISIFWLFKILTETLQKKNLEEKYGYSHFKSALKINFWLREVVKQKIHVYANTCIFSLTTSRSRKLILKADLKWECAYFYSKFFFWIVSVSILKSQKMDFPLYFQILRGRVPGFIFMREC